MPAPPPKRAHTEPRRLTSAAYNPRTRIASAATEVAISAAGLIAKAVGGEGKAASSFHALAPAGALGRTHPYGMAPLGNALVAEVGSAMNHRRRAGLGRLAVLEDEILLEVLGLLNDTALLTLACASRACYALVHHPALWRDRTLHAAAGPPARSFTFTTTWKDTYARLTAAAASRPAPALHVPLADTGFFSDTLFQAWAFGAMELDAAWLEGDTIPRAPPGLPLADFIREYEEPNKPVIFPDLVAQWPAATQWSDSYLEKAAPSTTLFSAGQALLTMADYLCYMKQADDERPLYIFDKHFAAKAPALGADYSVPMYFDESRDMFALLGKDRPHYRWIIIGPKKSGSSWHVDPNATSAWNGVVRGSKRWIMCPPGYTPPGVFPSPDGAAVATPISIIEWFVNYYSALQASDIPYLEGTVHAGELIFVPRGWWHVVINLEDAIAVTQNFVSASQLPHTLAFLRDKPDQVSGVAEGTNLYGLLRRAVELKDPALLAKAEAEMPSAARSKPPSLWAQIASSTAGEAVTDATPTSFSFGFG